MYGYPAQYPLGATATVHHLPAFPGGHQLVPRGYPPAGAPATGGGYGYAYGLPPPPHVGGGAPWLPVTPPPAYPFPTTPLQPVAPLLEVLFPFMLSTSPWCARTRPHNTHTHAHRSRLYVTL